MQVCNGSKTRETIPDPHTNNEKFIYSESVLIKRTIERAFLKRHLLRAKSRLLLYPGLFIEIKLEYFKYIP